MSGAEVREGRRRWTALRHHQVPLVAGVLALLPFAVSAGAVVLGVGPPWYPRSDLALTELHVRDVGRHTVELGLFSRDGWSHPGPLLFYLLAVPYRLLGGHPNGLLIGALAINSASVLGMALIARRRGGVPLLLCTLLASTLLLRALGAGLWQDPWVCYVTTLPFGLLLLLCWTMTCGDRWALPPAALVATFLAQAHVGFVTMGVPLLGWCVLGLAWRTHRERADDLRGTWRTLARPVALAVGLLAVLWLPTVLHELSEDDPNLARTVRYFRETEEEPHSLVESYRVVLGQFGLPPEWIAGVRQPNPLNGATPLLLEAPPPVLLLPVLAAMAVLLGRRHHDGLRLFGVVVVGLAVGVVAVSRVVGTMYQYRLLWTLLLPMLALTGTAWVAWTEIERRWPEVGRRLLTLTSLGALGIMAVVNSWSGFHADRPHPESSATARTLIRQLVPTLPEGDGNVLVRYPDGASSWYAHTVLNELERRGVDARVEDDDGRVFGDSRVHDDSEPVRAVLTVAVNDSYDKLASSPPGRLAAYVSDEPPAERARTIRVARRQGEEIQRRVESGELSLLEAAEALSGTVDVTPVTAVFLDVPAGGGREVAGG